MSINVNAVAKVVSAAITIEGPKAFAVASQLLSLITLAQEAYDGLKGDQKLQAVQAGLNDFVADLDPAIHQQFDRLWAFLKPAITVIVQISKLAGLFAPKPATAQPQG